MCAHVRVNDVKRTRACLCKSISRPPASKLRSDHADCAPDGGHPPSRKSKMPKARPKTKKAFPKKRRARPKTKRTPEDEENARKTKTAPQDEETATEDAERTSTNHIERHRFTRLCPFLFEATSSSSSLLNDRNIMDSFVFCAGLLPLPPTRTPMPRRGPFC